MIVIYKCTWGVWRHDYDPALHNDNSNSTSRGDDLARRFTLTSFTGMVILHILEFVLIAPETLPHLHAALFNVYAAGNLCLMYVVCVAWLMRITGFKLPWGVKWDVWADPDIFVKNM